MFLLIFIVKIVTLFISDTVELLQDLEVFKRWAFSKGLAAIVDNNNFLCLVHDTHMVKGSVRVDNVSFHVVLLSVKPFF